MTTTASLPRKVQTSEAWPVKLIVRIDDPRPCLHCSQEIAYYLDQFTMGDWVHTGTERIRCATEKFNIADPVPHCPKCSSRNITWTAETWGDRRSCPDCGYDNFSSIGD